MPRIIVEVASEPARCGADLIQHHKLGGLVCPRCGDYYDPEYLRALGLAQPLTCGAARRAGTTN